MPLSPSLPARVGDSNASEGGLGKGLSLAFTRAVVSFALLRVGVLPELPLCRKRVEKDEGMGPQDQLNCPHVDTQSSYPSRRYPDLQDRLTADACRADT
jgi:hypothetical protein